VWDLIEQFKREGRTIVLTTHYMDEAERLSDRVAVMDLGKVIASGTPAALIASIGADHLVELSLGGSVDLGPLQAIPGVRDTRHEDGHVQVQATELHRVVPSILEELTRQHVTLTELRTRSATLEDVFVSLTGRHLRDE